MKSTESTTIDSVAMEVRWHIYFFGRVQGVGFRYTCQETGHKHEVAGWVKNLPDGSVEMIVEGEISAIRAYVRDVCESTHGRVDDQQITKSDATGDFTEMTIRR